MLRDRVVGGHPKPHIWNQRPHLPIHYVTFMGLQRRLRRVYMGAPHCKAVLGRQFSKSRQNRALKWRFFENYKV